MSTINASLFAQLVAFNGSISISRTGAAGQFADAWRASLHHRAGVLDVADGATPDEAIAKVMEILASQSPEQRRIDQVARLREQLAQLEQTA